MSIERLDLGESLPRLDRRRLQEVLQTGGMAEVIDDLTNRWNEAMRKIEDLLNEQISERINTLLTYVNTDYAYFGTRDVNGNWLDGTYRIKYDRTSGELQVQRLLSGAWLNVHRFLRVS